MTDIFGYIFFNCTPIYYLRQGTCQHRRFESLYVTPESFQKRSAYFGCGNLTDPWLWQISKSANCKLHYLSYLYMYMGR